MNRIVALLVISLTVCSVGIAQAQGTWATKAPVPFASNQLGAAVVDGVLYVFGGWDDTRSTDKVAAYDPTTGGWTWKAPMKTPRCGMSVGVIGGKIYAVGGAQGWQKPAMDTAEAYDPATDAWTSLAPMQTSRVDAAAAVVNGILYVIGGGLVTPANPYSPVYVDIVEAYDPTTNSWSYKTPMPSARAYARAGAVDGKIYVIGGSATTNPHLGIVEAYDPATDTWTPGAPLSEPRNAHAVGEMNGLLYAVGGYGSTGPLATMEAYDPAANAWTGQEPMPAPRYHFAAGVIDGTMYAVGGRRDPYTLTTNEAFTPPTPEPSDTAPPVLTLPSDLIVEAAGPSGAAATYVASAHDAVDGPIAVTCAPASGFTFPVGVTPVSCSATDAAGNTATGSFTVTVLPVPPLRMLSNLIAMASGYKFQQGANLLGTILQKIASGDGAAACNSLSAFMNQVRAQTGKQLTPAQAASLVASAREISAALGCR